jgi:hypothetical protein
MLEAILGSSRAPLVFDVLVTAMPLVLIAVGFGLYQVRVHRNYDFHRKIQLTISAVLLIVVIWFEVNVRVQGWIENAQPSPFFNSGLFPFLYLHVAIAVSSAALWVNQVSHALRHFSKNYEIAAKEKVKHLRRGWLTIGMMSLTTITGWIFYYLAFVAS